HGEVIILAKGDVKTTNTAWAQGGIAGVLGSGVGGVGEESDATDTIASHIDDTMTAGAGVCDPAIVRLVAERAPGLIEELIGWGMKIDRDAQGHPALGREGGHSAARIIHAGGDATGRELQRT